MATKDELSDELNQMLGTDIDWSKLYMNDLEKLIAMVDDGSLAEPIIKHMVKKHGRKFVDEQIDEWYPGKILLG